LLAELLEGDARYSASIKVGVSPEGLGEPFVFIVQHRGERSKKLGGENGPLIFG